MPSETAAALLASARRTLTEAGIVSASLDSRLLLQHAAHLTHEQLIGDPGRRIDVTAAQRFRSCVARRLAHEPVSRIVGEREFYGRGFIVTPAVLDPRPDTETLIEAALAVMPPRCRLLDLGTGSGAIAVTLLAERPDATGDAVDISPEALAVARANAERLGIGRRLGFINGHWLDGVAGRYDLILSNPPYIPAGDIAGLSVDVRDFDPRPALDGGADGLDAYRQIAAAAGARLVPGGLVLVEIGHDQADAVQALFAADGFVLRSIHADLARRVRCLCFAGPN